MEEIKAYKPKCCQKAYIYKSSAVRHEKKCYKNPDNKACLTCNNFITDYNTIYVPPRGDQNYGDADYDVKYHYCEIDGKILGNPGQEVRGKFKPFQSKCNGWILKAGD